MEEVVEALLFGEREAQVVAARALGEFTAKQRHKVAEKGVIRPLISMLQTQDHKTIEAALFALLSLAFGSERNKVRIAKSGAVPVLIKLLQCRNMALIDLSIAALLILSSCTANKMEIAASGAIQCLIEFLNQDYTYNENSISMQAKLDIISTLHNLSICHQIIPSLVLSQVVFLLLQLICNSEKSWELVEKAMALLEKIVSSSETALREIASTGGGAIQALVEAIEEGSRLCKEHAVGILLMICRSCRERYKDMILREGAMPGLLQLSVDGTMRAKEMAQALLLLLRDCSGHRSKGKPLKNVFLEEVMEQIDAEDRMGTALMEVEEMIAKLTA